MALAVTFHCREDGLAFVALQVAAPDRLQYGRVVK